MPQWTTAQKNAIDASGCNILVSAAAGSGKTTVLTHRVVNMITNKVNPIDIDRLLIVTFTKAAAAEMRSRISKALAEKSLKNPNDTNVLRQISLLPSAKICTIDAFCNTLVRENFYQLDGVSQDFEILDDAQRRLIEDTVINELLEEHYEMGDADFHTLVELLSSEKNDKNLIEVIKKISEYIAAQPFPQVWLQECCELYNPAVSVKDSVFGKYVLEEVQKQAHTALNLIEQASGFLYEGYELKDKYEAMLSEDAAVFQHILQALDGDWDTLCSVAHSGSFKKIVVSRKYETVKEMTGLRATYKSILSEDIKPLLVFSEEQIVRDNESLYPIIHKLCELVEEYDKRTLAVKRELNSYSFSDVMHFAVMLLFEMDSEGRIVKTDLARECEKHYAEILVDEYQDTNAAQDMLFEKLSNGRNRFMVGDVKQSIYRFRLAMPEIFNAKKDSFTPYSENCGDGSQKIILDQNFRSRKDICEFTNFIFSHLMSREIGELEYNDEDYLHYGSDYETAEQPFAKLVILKKTKGENADEYEAAQAAEYILQKVKSKQKVRDGKTYRDVRYSDFAILFRSAKKRIPTWRKVFDAYGIPTTANNKENLFDNNEVSVLMSLLRTVDNPSREVPLLATLMSVFYGYSADQIAQAKVNGGAANLYGCVLRSADVFADFIRDMDTYRQYAASMSVENFLRRVISDTSFLSVISAMGDGEQRRLNVMKLINLAAVFDKGESVGLTAFIRFVDGIIDNKVEVDSAELSAAGSGCVQLMTVHASKGLEFPICIFAGAGNSYNKRDLGDLIQLNNRSGVGLKGYNEERMYRYPTLQYNCIKNMNAVSAMSENLRVLYVAITRAKEEFIAFASYENPAKIVNEAASALINGHIPPSVVKHTSNDGKLLLMCALMHPDAKALRDLTDIDVAVDNKFDFPLEILFDADLNVQTDVPQEPAPVDEEMLRHISEKLAFRYERSALSGFSAKRSASKLDERDVGFRFFATAKPAFLDSAHMTAAEKGTAMHAFMQYADIRAAKQDTDAEITRLVQEKLITEEQAAVLERDKVERFLCGSVAARMMASERVWREIKLATLIPACEIEDTEFDDPILVQGIADCIFEEDGALVLVDYKTDFVKSEEELLSHYKKQVAFYKRAAEKTLKMPVKESLLYSFALGKECVYK